LSGLPPGLYRVTCEKPWTLHKRVQLKPGEDSKVDFQYTPGHAHVQGRVSVEGDAWADGGEVMVFVYQEHSCPLQLGEPFSRSLFDKGLLRVKTLAPYQGDLFEFTDLPSGPLDLVAVRVTRGIITQNVLKTIILDGSETSVVELNLSP
jgi:hypothetical protein